jgi:hypothetical protein
LSVFWRLTSEKAIRIENSIGKTCWSFSRKQQKLSIVSKKKFQEATAFYFELLGYKPAFKQFCRIGKLDLISEKDLRFNKSSQPKLQLEKRFKSQSPIIS